MKEKAVPLNSLSREDIAEAWSTVGETLEPSQISDQELVSVATHIVEHWIESGTFWEMIRDAWIEIHSTDEEEDDAIDEDRDVLEEVFLNLRKARDEAWKNN